MTSDCSNLKWDLFPRHVQHMIEEMYSTDYLADVTLICEDQRSLRAHKVILGASSPVFRNINENFREKESVIYLKGIKYEQMESVLRFMYLGEVKISEDSMNGLLNVAKEFQIKGLLREEVKGGAQEIKKETAEDVQNKIGDVVLDQDESRDGSKDANLEIELNELDQEKNNKLDLDKTKKKTKGKGGFLQQCPQCSLELDSQWKFKRHLNSHLPKENKLNLNTSEEKPSKEKKPKENPLKENEFICTKCGENFRNKVNFLSHMHKHRREVHCDFEGCNELLQNKHYYLDHMLLIHKKVVKTNVVFPKRKKVQVPDDNEEKNLGVKGSLQMCQECGKSVKEIRKHIEHMHTRNTNDFVCGKCGKGFKTKPKLRDHTSTVHEAPTIPCPFCDKLLATKHRLQKHVKNYHVEADQKLYQCNECNSGFSTNSKDKYEGHMNDHKKIRPYKCDICEKSYHNRLDLYCHKRNTHPPNVLKMKQENVSQVIIETKQEEIPLHQVKQSQ